MKRTFSVNVREFDKCQERMNLVAMLKGDKSIDSQRHDVQPARGGST